MCIYIYICTYVYGWKLLSHYIVGYKCILYKRLRSDSTSAYFKTN